ncbi:MAG: FxsA family protein [Actinomycetota bacterium]|nr:FxsA family protein [Actinomycetota bacterium]
MLALLLMVLWPVAELFVAIKVGEAIGALLTVLALIAGWPLGIWLMRAEGRGALRRLSAAIAAGRPPGREVLDGALVLSGGLLLIVPGFITDGLGLALLLPPGRALARRGIVRNFRSRVVVRATRFADRGRPEDVDATAADVDAPQLRR